MHEQSETKLRQLERLTTGREGLFSLCLLTYASSEQRERLAGLLKTRLGATEVVEVRVTDEVSTDDLIDRIGVGGKAPVQVMDLDQWPEGLKNAAYRLNLARPKFAERCSRTILVWLRDAELTTVLKASPDLCAWSSGIFEFHDTPLDGETVGHPEQGEPR